MHTQRKNSLDDEEFPAGRCLSYISAGRSQPVKGSTWVWVLSTRKHTHTPAATLWLVSSHVQQTD